MNQSTEKNYPGTEDCFRHSFDDAEIGMALVDLDGRWLRVNRALCQIVGYSEADLLDSPFQQITHPEDQAASSDHLRDFLAHDGSGPRLEKRCLHRDGHVIWVRVTLSLIWNAEGQPRLLLAQIEDVTTHRLVEHALRESEERFRLLASSAPLGIFVVNREGNMIYANPKWEEITGLTQDESLEAKWKKWLHPGDREDVLAAWNTAIQNGSEFNREFRFLNPGGKTFWMQGTMAPLRDTTGQITSHVGSCVNTSPVKILQQQLAEQKALLESETARAQAASNLKSKFLTHMSHELRSPLHGIIGFSELLHDQKPGPLNAQQLDFIGEVLQGSRHILRLIDDLLDLSRIEAGRLWLNPENFSLREVIASVSGALQPLIQRKSISCSAEIWLETDNVYLDRQKISQILYNLLSNAIKFTPEGGSILLRATERNGLIELAVHDTGIGIKPEDIGRLFAEFEQLETDPHYRHHGTGLGLMLTRKLALLHGGNIRVESVHGHSTTFIVSLPHSISTRNQP